MTSAECTMGLRSFLINDEQNARRCVNNPAEKHDLEEEEQFTEDSAMISSMSNSYSPHKYNTGRNMATGYYPFLYISEKVCVWELSNVSNKIRKLL